MTKRNDNTKYSGVPSLAKRALTMAVEEKLDTLTRSMGVADQMNASHLCDVLEMVNSLTRVEAYKVAKAIDEAEYYDADADKYGFGPREINPIDFAGFMRPESISELGRLI